MKKKLMLLLYFAIILFAGIINVSALETYEYNKDIGWDRVNIKCDANNNSFSAKIGSYSKNIYHRENNVDKTNYEVINLSKPVSIGNTGRVTSKLYYVELNNKRLYFEPLLLNSVINNKNCLEISIFWNNTLPDEIKNTTSVGIAYYNPALSPASNELISQYKINCQKYSDALGGSYEIEADYINLYKGQSGYFISVRGSIPLIDNAGNFRWCKIGDTDCINNGDNTQEVSVCGSIRRNFEYTLGELNNNAINLVNKNIRLYKITQTLTPVLSVDYITDKNHEYIDTIYAVKENNDIMNDNNLFSCNYNLYMGYTAFDLALNYSPATNKFIVSGDFPYSATSSEELVRGTLKETMKNKYCFNKVKFCYTDSVNAKDNFFTDYTEYYQKYKKNKNMICWDLETKTDNSYVLYYYSNLKNHIKNLDASVLDYEIKINDKITTLKSISAIDSTCKQGECDSLTHINNILTDFMSYCNYVVGEKPTNTTEDRDCASFVSFYKKLVENNILADLTSGCDFVTSELQEKIIWILDLIKIAGPILALGLGTLDFIKAIASGDVDKEMKTAFKRFSTRVIAAALLFIIPVILAFLMDVFLGNEDGYDSDNPFCNVVDWDD